MTTSSENTSMGTFAERVRASGLAASPVLKTAMEHVRAGLALSLPAEPSSDGSGAGHTGRLFSEVPPSIDLHAVDLDVLPGIGSMRPLAKPTHVMVNPRAVSFRLDEYTVKSGTPFLAALAAGITHSVADVRALRDALNMTDTISDACRAILARPGRTMSRGRYLVTADAVDAAVRKHATTGASDVAIALISHFLKAALDHLRLLVVTASPSVVRWDPSFFLGHDDLRRVVVEETLRDILAAHQISSFVPSADVTPEVLVDGLRRLARAIATGLPSLTLRLRQLDHVRDLVTAATLTPDLVEEELLLDPGLIHLTSLANWVWLSPPQIGGALTRSNADYRADVADIGHLIARSSMVSVMPIEQVEKWVGLVHVGGPENPERGLVLYSLTRNETALQLIEARSRADGFEAAEVSSRFFPHADIKSALAASLAPDYCHGMANIVADVLDGDQDDMGGTPVVCLLGDLAVDSAAPLMTLLAIARSAELAVAIDPNGTYEICYGVRLADRWRGRVAAATPDHAYCGSALTAYVLTQGPDDRIAQPYEAGPARLPVRAETDTVILGLDTSYLVGGLADTLVVKIKPSPRGGRMPTLSLKLNLLGDDLAMWAGAISGDRYSYVVVADLVLASFFRTYFGLAAGLAHAAPTHGRDDVAQHAKSWLIEQIVAYCSSPAVIRAATSALTRAVIDSKVDARRMQAQYRELVARSHAAASVAALVQVGVLSKHVAFLTVDALPEQELTAKARISYAMVPSRLPSAF